MPIKASITKKITLELEGEQIHMLKALCQNPHPQYQTSEELMTFAEELHVLLMELVGPKYKSQRELMADDNLLEDALDPQ